MSTTEKIERKVIRALLREGIKQGYAFNVHNGGDGMELKAPTTSIPKLMDTLFATGSEHLIVYKDGKRFSWVFLVHGNGSCVISDYGVNSESIMGPANAVADAEDKRRAIPF